MMHSTTVGQQLYLMLDGCASRPRLDTLQGHSLVKRWPDKRVQRTKKLALTDGRARLQGGRNYRHA